MNGDEDAEVIFDEEDEWYSLYRTGKNWMEREKKMNVDSSLGNIQSRDPDWKPESNIGDPDKYSR